jgi:hypothetical protein
MVTMVMYAKIRRKLSANISLSIQGEIRMSLSAVYNIISPYVDFEALAESFRAAKPFNHMVIYNFFEPKIARASPMSFRTSTAKSGMSITT